MRIGFVTSNAHFHEAILEELSRRGHEVLLYRHTDDPVQNAYQLGQLRAQAQRVFVDWVQPPREQVLAHFDCPIFVRCHRIEMYSDAYIQALDWERVSCLFFIAAHVQERFLAKLTRSPRRVENLGHVGVDVDFFNPDAATRRWAPPWRIVVAGNVVPKKRVYTAVQLVHDLGDDFHLEVYGSGGQPGYGNPEYAQNVSDLVEELGMAPRMRADKHLPPEQLRERLCQAHIVLSASNEEGCATIVAEGMACGCVPMVNSWRGVRNTYPSEWVWRSPSELYALARQWASLDEDDKAALSAAMRRFVLARYDRRAIAARVCDIVTGPLEGEPLAAEAQADLIGRLISEDGNDQQHRTLALVREHLPRGGSFLDLGCGTGYVARTVAQESIMAYGQDILRGALQYARRHNPGYALFELCDATKAIVTGPHDVIAMAGLLEELQPRDREALLVRCADQLRPGGTLVCRFGRDGGGAYVFPKVLRRQCEAAGLQVAAFGEHEDGCFEIIAKKGAS